MLVRKVHGAILLWVGVAHGVSSRRLLKNSTTLAICLAAVSFRNVNSSALVSASTCLVALR